MVMLLLWPPMATAVMVFQKTARFFHLHLGRESSNQRHKPLNEFALNFSFFLFALIFHRRCSGRQKKINNKARYRKKVNRYSHTSAGRPGKQSK